MHKLLKNNNEATALLFVTETSDEATIGDEESVPEDTVRSPNSVPLSLSLSLSETMLIDRDRERVDLV